MKIKSVKQIIVLVLISVAQINIIYKTDVNMSFGLQVLIELGQVDLTSGVTEW